MMRKDASTSETNSSSNDPIIAKFRHYGRLQCQVVRECPSLRDSTMRKAKRRRPYHFVDAFGKGKGTIRFDRG
jgi:hypothetical protein